MSADEKTKFSDEKTKYGNEDAEVEAHRYMTEEPSEDDAAKTKYKFKTKTKTDDELREESGDRGKY
jgi:hypothetical protein